jgi:hypothetical protein
VKRRKQMIKKKCIVCGKEYEYCGHCDKNPKINRWKNQYCSENCRDIFKTVTDYVGNLIDVKTAKRQTFKIKYKHRYDKTNFKLHYGYYVIY